MSSPSPITFISGPSGVGKGTVINALRERHPDWVFPPSCTTRDPRPGEIEGKTYYFVSHEEFLKREKAGEFLEYAEVHGGNLYGTLLHKILDPYKDGQTVIREFDVQGFVQAREKLDRSQYRSIFLSPEGDISLLIERIKKRAPIAEEDLAHRMESLKKEMELSHLYDHIVYSREGEIEAMVEEVEEIIREDKR